MKTIAMGLAAPMAFPPPRASLPLAPMPPRSPPDIPVCPPDCSAPQNPFVICDVSSV
jgi:hypothetical protein